MPGLNKKRVEEIFTRSKQEKWAYPRIFDALKEAGVEYYETDVATHDIVYHGSGDSIPEPPRQEFILLKPGASFAAAGVKLAMERNKTKPDYMVFLKKIARAGVVRYRVDMSARDVTYLGAAGQAYVEKVPPGSKLRRNQDCEFSSLNRRFPLEFARPSARDCTTGIGQRSGDESNAKSKISKSSCD